MNTKGHRVKVVIDVKSDMIYQLDAFADIIGQDDSANVYELPFQNLLIDNFDR